MVHATRGHACEFCDFTAYGNGGHVAHQRAHVRRGETVELVKDYATYPPMSSRRFVPAADKGTIDRLLGEGYGRVS